MTPEKLTLDELEALPELSLSDYVDPIEYVSLEQEPVRLLEIITIALGRLAKHDAQDTIDDKNLRSIAEDLLGVLRQLLEAL